MPSFHVIIGVDLLLVHAPAGGRPGSALYPDIFEDERDEKFSMASSYGDL